MKVSLYLFALIAAYSFREGHGAVNFTEPRSGSVIPNIEGAVNATTISCTITRDSPTGPQITTQWNVGNFRGNGESLVAITAAPELFSVGGDPIPNTNFLFDNELTILDWAAELDGVIVYCGTGADPQQASFTLKIYRPPNLRDNFLVMVEENTINAVIDLRQEPAAFPEPTMFTWRKNGQLLTRFDQTFSNVTIPSVERADAGNYSVFTTNFELDGQEQVGNDSGSFYLDVIYGPSFRFDGPQQMPTQAYVLLGNPLSLVCGRGLESNPEASITWLDTNDMAIMDNARYDLENGTAIVRLNFTRTIASDNGMWTCEVVVRSERYIVDSEGELVRGGLAVIGTILRHRFIVTVIAPPGQPRSLGIENVGATWVRICWEAPFDIDFPISRYEIIARPLDNVDAMVVNMSTTDNRTLINVTNLDPGTTYNFSVVAVIEAGEVVARGMESESLGDIMTITTVPEVVCPRPVSQDGNIIVSWSFVHTGGLPLTNISVSLSFQQGLSTESRNVSVPGGISARSVTVPNLVAGETYIFNVTAENTNGSSTVQCEGILHILGVPATPEFGMLTMGGRGEIIIQLKTVASGVNSPIQDFNFIIIPFLSGIEQTEQSFPFPAYMSGEFVSITVDELQPGANYMFSATAMNIFGTSGSANSPTQVAGGDSPSSNPQPSPGDTSNSTAIAVGVAIPVIVLAIVVVVVVLVILFIFLRKNKDHGNYKVEGGKYHKASTSDPGVRVEDATGVDIGTDLEKPPRDTEHEIQYAELDTFRPPSQQKNNSNEAKPVLPEEPVEYAVITTFKKKEEPPPAATESSAVPDPTPEAADANNDADKAGTSTTLV